MKGLVEVGILAPENGNERIDCRVEYWVSRPSGVKLIRNISHRGCRSPPQGKVCACSSGASCFNHPDHNPATEVDGCHHTTGDSSPRLCRSHLISTLLWAHTSTSAFPPVAAFGSSHSIVVRYLSCSARWISHSPSTLSGTPSSSRRPQPRSGQKRRTNPSRSMSTPQASNVASNAASRFATGPPSTNPSMVERSPTAGSG